MSPTISIFKCRQPATSKRGFYHQRYQKQRRALPPLYLSCEGAPIFLKVFDLLKSLAAFMECISNKLQMLYHDEKEYTLIRINTQKLKRSGSCVEGINPSVLKSSASLILSVRKNFIKKSARIWKSILP